jgi:organic hydroperoxide reductase OsmC/OhrA
LAFAATTSLPLRENNVSKHSATIQWTGDGGSFVDQHYSRRHVWRFDGGAEVAASSSPHAVPLPYSDPTAVDPEEAFIASIASCHMLWFLSIAAKHGHVVQSYTDEASGTMGRNEEGQMAILRVTLRPQAVFATGAIDPEALRTLHDEAHRSCFIAHSVKATIVCEPVV